MCQRIKSRPLLFFWVFYPRSHDAPHLVKAFSAARNDPQSVYDAWLASREIPAHKGLYLVPGAQRRLNLKNTRLAWYILENCAADFFKILWGLNPVRTTLMMSLNIIRSLFPAFRGYSQAMIIDELQSLIASGSFTWQRLLRLILSEIFRRMLESALDSLAYANENVVLGSARFFVDYKQMEHRVRLDVPTLTDPVVRDLLQESELFARSFNGSGFGLLSPLDFVHIVSLTTEIVSHIWLVLSLTRGATHLGVLFFSLFSAILPFLISWLNVAQQPPELLHTERESQAAARHERMRNMAYNDAYRSEIALFGLKDWILQSWATARKTVLAFEQPTSFHGSTFISQEHMSDLMFAIQNIPLVLLMQTSSTSLGSLSLYRTSIQSLFYACGHLITTVKMAFQGIFLMSAFCASTDLHPRLQPKDEDVVAFKPLPGGIKIEARGLSYSYPGSTDRALENINFTIMPGESLAIVGYNGSGKSTLAKVLLRIIDFDEGELRVNGVDVRRYHPDEYHEHLTGVFQNFSKYNSTVKENVGLGYVPQMGHRSAINEAIHLAEAENIVQSLPHGLKTVLETSGFEPVSYPGMSSFSTDHHGLSGGEWQRLAIARAFMKARQPEVDLLLFDEPTSSLDAHAQNQIFDTIEKIASNPSGERIKSVIFITHRLSTARRADKIAMMENGTISEFGTHQELLAKNGSYAALYRASV